VNVHRQLVKFRKQSHVSWGRNQYPIQTYRTPPILNFITLHQLLIFDNRWWACLWSFKCGCISHWSFVQVYWKYARVVQQNSNSQSAFTYLASTGEMNLDPCKKTILSTGISDGICKHTHTHKHKHTHKHTHGHTHTHTNSHTHTNTHTHNMFCCSLNFSAFTFLSYRRVTSQITHLKTNLSNYAQSYTLSIQRTCGESTFLSNVFRLLKQHCFL
jgi:hypothetical protein